MLPREFFSRSSVVVAKDLIGKILVRKIGNKIERFEITETEAYEGFKDLASHASRGKTLRNAPMFEGAGTIYVYFTYGMHWMFNIVCGVKGYPRAVLIRGVGSSSSPSPKERGIGPNLIGPGRLTKYLKIDKELNNKKLGRASGLWIEDCTKMRDRAKVYNQNKIKIARTPRIGVAYAGPIWSQKSWRFVLKKKAAHETANS